MDLAIELHFLAVFSAVMLLGQVLLVVSWLAAKALARAIAARGRRAGGSAEHGALTPAVGARSALDGAAVDATG